MDKIDQLAVIDSSIAHLNGYSKVLESINIPSFAVEDNIRELKRLNDNEKQRIRRGLKKAGVIL